MQNLFCDAGARSPSHLGRFGSLAGILTLNSAMDLELVTNFWKNIIFRWLCSSYWYYWTHMIWSAHFTYPAELYLYSSCCWNLYRNDRKQYESEWIVHWVSVSEPHLMLLTCEPHTVCSRVVSIDLSLMWRHQTRSDIIWS